MKTNCCQPLKRLNNGLKIQRFNERNGNCNNTTCKFSNSQKPIGYIYREKENSHGLIGHYSKALGCARPWDPSHGDI